MMLDSVKQEFVYLRDICYAQLSASRQFLVANDRMSERIALILVHNTSEVLLRSAEFRDRSPVNDTDADSCGHALKDLPKRQKKGDYKPLIDALCRLGILDCYDAFLLKFVHSLRNEFYHSGYPQGWEFAMKVPERMKQLVVAYHNMVSDLMVAYGSHLWPSPRGASVFERDDCSDFATLKVDVSPVSEFHCGANALLHFYSSKYLALEDMVGFVCGRRRWQSPGSALKWHEFWDTGYIFRSQDEFRRDYESFTPKFDNRRFLRAGNALLTGIEILNRGSSKSERGQLAGRLQMVHAILSDYEGIISSAFEVAEDAVEMQIQAARGN
jgi:hypothetical protein